jgi:hypothetical protein
MIREMKSNGARTYCFGDYRYIPARQLLHHHDVSIRIGSRALFGSEAVGRTLLKEKRLSPLQRSSLGADLERIQGVIRDVSEFDPLSVAHVPTCLFTYAQQRWPVFYAGISLPSRMQSSSFGATARPKDRSIVSRH